MPRECGVPCSLNQTEHPNPPPLTLSLSVSYDSRLAEKYNSLTVFIHARH